MLSLEGESMHKKTDNDSLGESKKVFKKRMSVAVQNKSLVLHHKTLRGIGVEPNLVQLSLHITYFVIAYMVSVTKMNLHGVSAGPPSQIYFDLH